MQITLEPSSYTEEKFALYQSYQRDIHHEEEKQPGSFKRFLVETSLRVTTCLKLRDNTYIVLQEEEIPYPETPPEHLPRAYGSYHMLYRLDGKLVAMGVVDILPECVSSVYFMYQKEWERLSLGKVRVYELHSILANNPFVTAKCSARDIFSQRNQCRWRGWDAVFIHG